MKIKFTCLIFSLLALFSLTSTISAQALKHESNHDGLQFSLRFEDYRWTEREHQGRTFIEVEAPNHVPFGTIGHPALPARIVMIEIPQGASLRVEILSSQFQDYRLKDLTGIEAPLFPMQAPIRKSLRDQTPFHFDQDAYQGQAWMQSSLVETQIIGESRGVRMAKVIIKPLDYIPAQGLVRIYQELQFKVHFDHADMQATQAVKIGLEDQNYQRRLHGVIALPQQRAKNVIGSTAPIRYVIVTPTKYEASLRPFIQWKRQKGFDVEVAIVGSAEVGSTSTSIYNYLKGLYDNRSESKPAPSYILLAGDVEDVPVFSTKVPNSSGLVSANDKHITDLYYAEYTGDYLPEVYYGRFSAATSVQMDAIVEKTLAMEQLNIPSTSFLGKTMLIAGSESRTQFINMLNRTIDYISTYYVNTDNEITPTIFRSPQSEGRVQDIRSGISAGVGLVNYTAHGDWDEWQGPVITINHINALTNINQYPLVIGNCCLTSKFEKPECFAEAWIRAYQKGAVAYVGASNSSYFSEDYWWSVGGIASTTTTPTYENTKLGVYDRLFHTHDEDPSEWIQSLGEMIYQGNMSVEHSGGSSMNYMYHYYWEIYHVMGDPSYMPYTSEPKTMIVQSDDVLLQAIDQLEVTAEPYAYVGLTIQDTLVGAALCDANGQANIRLMKLPEVGSSIMMVVTAQNRVPFIKSIDVVSSDKPFIRSTALTLNPSPNAANNILLGQTYQVQVTLENLTGHTANNVKVELSSTDSNVVITKAIATGTDIAANKSATLQEAFTFRTKLPAMDQQKIPFKLKAICGDGQFTEQPYNYTLQAPKPQLLSYEIQSPEARLALNSESMVVFRVKNVGTVSMNAITFEAICDRAGVSMQVQDASLPSLGVGESKDIRVKVGLNSTIETNDLLKITLLLTSQNNTYPFEIGVGAGAAIERFENDFNPQIWTDNGSWLLTDTDRGKSAKSPTISHNSSAEMRIQSFDYHGVDSLVFFYKVSSESFQGGGDGLEVFFIKEKADGTEETPTLMGFFSGQKPWTRQAFSMPKGRHSIVFSYIKDELFSEGEDAAWVDDVLLPTFDGKIGNPNRDQLDLPEHLMFDVIHADHQLHARINAQKEGQARVELRDPLGRLVAVIADQTPYHVGANDYYLSTEGLAPGLYICVFVTSQTSVARKVVIR